METIETLPGPTRPDATTGWLNWLTRQISGLSWHRLGLLGIMVLTAWFYLFRLQELGYNNEYYASAVKSMLANWSNFFYVAFDPTGFISVDKPPVFLWVQAASAWLLGFSGLSMLLPQALAGIASVGLIHHLVKRVFGPTAGLLAALALALTPIFVVTSRHNNPESLLILALLIQVWALTKAVESGRLRWVLAVAGLAALAFNIKMLEAFVVLPAFYLVYLLMGRGHWLKRLTQLALASLLLLALSLSWTLLVDATPPEQRPFVGSSTNNTVVNLILGYNGLGRTEGAEGSPGGGGSFSSVSLAGQAGPLRLFFNNIAGEVNWLTPLALLGLVALVRQSVAGFKTDKFKNPRNTALLIWSGWLASFGLIFSLAKGTIHPYYLVMLAPPIAALFGAGLVALWQEYRREDWSGWLLPIGLLFNTVYQVYILTAYPAWNGWLSPLVMGLSLVGVISLVAGKLLRSPAWLQRWGGRLGLGLTFSLLIVPVAWSLNQLYVTPLNPTLPSARPGVETDSGLLGNRYIWDNVMQPAWGDWLTNILPSLGLLAVCLLAIVKQAARFNRPVVRWRVLLGGLVLLVAVSLAGFTVNAAWSKNSGAVATEATQPVSRLDEKLVQYLTANTSGQTYLAAVTNTTLAAPLILETGRPVIAIGGYMGIDPALSADQAEQLVSEHRLRFFLVAADNGFGNVSAEAGTSAIYKWASQKCSVVDTSLWRSSSNNSNTLENPQPGVLFDCGSMRQE